MIESAVDNEVSALNFLYSLKMSRRRRSFHVHIKRHNHPEVYRARDAGVKIRTCVDQFSLVIAAKEYCKTAHAHGKIA